MFRGGLLPARSHKKGSNMLDSSVELLCLFVIPGSCDFSGLVLVDSSAKHTMKNQEHKTNRYEAAQVG